MASRLLAARRSEDEDNGVVGLEWVAISHVREHRAREVAT
jgi:hypothetical protein